MSQHIQVPTKEIIYGRVPALVQFDVNFNDTGIASGVKKFTIIASVAKPVLIIAFAEVITAFNAVTTNVLTLGTDTTANQILAAADITEGTPGFYPTSLATGMRRLTANTDIYAKYTQSGTAATTGKAKFYIEITPLEPVNAF